MSRDRIRDVGFPSRGARPSDYATQPLPPVYPADGRPAPGAVPRPGMLTGRVVEKGIGVACALVTARSNGLGLPQALSDEGGRFILDRVRAGPVRLSVRTFDGRFAGRELEVPPAGWADAGDLDLNALPRGEVRGRLIDARGPVPVAPVLIRSVASGPEWQTWRLTGPDGGYAFRHVPAGAVELQALDATDWSTRRAVSSGVLAAGGVLVRDLLVRGSLPSFPGHARAMRIEVAVKDGS